MGAIPSSVKQASATGFPKPNESFDKLAPLEAGNFWFCNRNRLIVWAISKFFANARTFMEVGCGTGFVLSGIHKSFPSLQLTGTELHAPGLAYATARLPFVEFIQLDARRMDFKESFDLIGSFDVLEHIDEDTVVLEHMRRAIKEGGGIVLTVPQHRNLWSRADDYACHVRRYSRNELIGKVEAAGFEILLCNSFVTWLLPVMLFSRLLERVSLKPYDPLAELKIPGWLNKLFYVVLSLEQTTIRLGVNYVIGGSLLLVARRK